jgi:UDP-N-acetylglucosamine--N-acetylmuramyl-(pentapeptide) pyrophosphoryl-undecaprenol N-acetylglucosamine transferase
VTPDASRAFFRYSRRVVTTGYPIRPDLHAWDAAAARQTLGLLENLPTVLFFGGSKGARSMNQAAFSVLRHLLQQAQVVHITGQLDWPAVAPIQASLAPETAARYHPTPYLHEMGAALAAADVAVSRAGASTLGELPLFGLPAVLVPYPYAWRYQKVNAQYLERHDAAMVLEDASLASTLLPTLQSLLGDPHRLSAMRAAMRSLAQPQAAQAIAAQLRDMVAVRTRRR